MPDFLSNAKMNQVSPAGSVYPMRFICPDGTQGAFMCRQATAQTDLPLGVSQAAFNLDPGIIYALSDGASNDPNVAGAPGSQIAIYTSGDVCPVRLGGSVTAGDTIGNHTDGTAIKVAPLTGSRYIGGVALQNGLTGDIIEMYVLPGRA